MIEKELSIWVKAALTGEKDSSADDDYFEVKVSSILQKLALLLKRSYVKEDIADFIVLNLLKTVKHIDIKRGSYLASYLLKLLVKGKQIHSNIKRAILDSVSVEDLSDNALLELLEPKDIAILLSEAITEGKQIPISADILNKLDFKNLGIVACTAITYKRNISEENLLLLLKALIEKLEQKVV